VTFDNETPDTNSSPYAGFFPGAIQSAIFSIGNQSFALPLGDGANTFAYSYNDLGTDYYQFSFQTSSGGLNGLPLLTSNFSFWSTSPLALDTDAIPSSPPADLGSYQAYASVSLYQTEEQLNGAAPFPALQGHVDNIRAVAVPEPASITLFAAGLIGAGLARRQRRIQPAS
jgi:hypothetical protein